MIKKENNIKFMVCMKIKKSKLFCIKIFIKKFNSEKINC